MDYDVLILGGGLTGCSLAYELSKYNLNIALIEKDYDIADDISLVNTEIIYDGIENNDDKIAALESRGNELLKNLTNKLQVPLNICGSIMLSEDAETDKELESMYSNAKKRGIKGVKILDKHEARVIEPKLPHTFKKALYCRDVAVISPYDLALGYGEVAFENNVNFRLQEEVIDIEKISKGFSVETTKNKFTCKVVLNTTPFKNYSIDIKEEVLEDVEKKSKNSNGIMTKYFALNRYFKSNFSRVIFAMNKDNIQTMSVPSNDGETIGAVNVSDNIKNDVVLEEVSKLIPNIDSTFINVFFKSSFNTDSDIIDYSMIDSGYIKIRNNHYALVTLTPAIAEQVANKVVELLKCKRKKEFIDKRREYYKFRTLSNEERSEIIKVNDQYGKIICSCEKVTEGEIIDAIRRPLGARTLEGVKRRTGACVGKCQGSECIAKIISILARETNKAITDIVKDSKNSNIILGRIKEFDEM